MLPAALPLKLQLANTVLAGSKAPHDAAIDWTVQTSSWLATHDCIPDAAVSTIMHSLANLLLLGDSFGHALMLLYAYVLTHL